MQKKTKLFKNKRIIAIVLLAVSALLISLTPAISNAESISVNLPGICCSNTGEKAAGLAEEEKANEEQEGSGVTGELINW